MVAVYRSLQSYMRKYSLPTVNTYRIKQQLATTENYNVLRHTWSLVNTCTSVQFESSVRKGLQLAAADAMYNGVFCSLRSWWRHVRHTSFILLYKSMVRPHLEYANSVWCPYKMGDIKAQRDRKSPKKSNQTYNQSQEYVIHKQASTFKASYVKI